MYTAGEFDAPYFQNQSCDPYTPVSQPCVLGNYASFSINVTCAEDVIAGLEFAKKQNVRVVIKNTGHEYEGESNQRCYLLTYLQLSRKVNGERVIVAVDFQFERT